MGSWLYILFIALVTVPYKCRGSMCGTTKLIESDWDESSCHCESSLDVDPNTDYDKYRREILVPNIRFSLNETSGEGIASFPLPEKRCSIHNFKIELRLANASGEESCNKFAPNKILGDPNHIFQIHSDREYNTNVSVTRNSKLCSKNAEVHFFYVFTGCYYVVVTAYDEKGNMKRPAETKPQYVMSNVTKQEVELMGRNTTVAVHYYTVKNTLVPRFSLGLPDASSAKSGPMLLSLELRGLHKLGEHACTRNSFDHDCCVMRENSGTGVCTSDPANLANHCLVDNNFVECTFFNVTAGNYCVLFQVQDDRCNIGTLWSQHKSNSEAECLWTHVYEVKNDGTGVSEVLLHGAASRWHMWVILGAVVTAIFAMLMYGLFVLLTMSRNGDIEDLTNLRALATDDNSQSPLMLNTDQKLLLLYARDCQAFMDLMENLRQTLEKYCKCEVLDCYDEENQKAIFTYENDWLLNHLRQSPDTKVILVVTECAAAHQLAQLGARSTVEYKDPEPFDKLFPLALKLLKEDVDPGLYNRIKLVEFSGFKVENESSINWFPTPFTRYVLPTDFKELVCTIQQLSSRDRVNMCEDDLKSLHSLLEDLLQYKKDNPTYLNTIITTS